MMDLVGFPTDVEMRGGELLFRIGTGALRHYMGDDAWGVALPKKQNI